MARDTVDSTPIETVADLAATLEEGCKPEEKFLIGTEHEKFGFCLNELTPIPYGGEKGVEAILTGIGLIGL